MLEKTELDTLQELILNENFSKTHEVEDMLVFLGDTGVGKSTVITYLLGNDFEWSDEKNGIVLTKPSETSHPEFATDDTKSCTIHAGIFDRYCDCPGFEDNRGNAHRICASISTEVTIKAAKSIKGIAIVLNWEILTRTKYKSLLVVAKTLAKIIPSFDENEIPSSLFFLVNNNPKPRGSCTEETIAKKAFELKEKIGKGDIKVENASKRDYEKIVSLLNIISTAKNNVFILDIEDQGRSRNNFLEKINNSKCGIRKSDFHFDNYDESRCIFDKQIEKHAHEGSILINDYLNSLKNKDKNHEMILSIKKQNKLSEEIQPMLEKLNGIKLSENEENKNIIIRALDNSIIELENDIKENSIEIEMCEKERTSIENEIRQYDTNEMIVLWNSSVHEKRMRFFGWMTNAKTEKTFSYCGIPFKEENISETFNSDQGGQFSRTNVKPEEGIYQANYKSAAGGDGAASVTIKIESKIRHKDHIDRLKLDLEQKKSMIEKLYQDTKALNTQKSDRIKFKKTIEEENPEKIQKEIVSFTEKLNIKVTEEIEINSQKEQQSIEKVEQNIKEKETWFKLIVRIDKHLKYDIPAIKSFLKLYQEYLTKNKLEKAKNNSLYIEVNRIKALIDENIVNIVNLDTNDFLEIKSCSELVEEYLNKVKKLEVDISLEKYEGYHLLCKAWLINEDNEPSKSQRSKNLIDALNKLDTAFRVISSDENIIDIILCNEFKKEYLTRDSIINILNQYKSYFKDSLRTTYLSETRHWIVLPKIMQCISNEKGAGHDSLMSLLKEFLELANTHDVLQKLLLINNQNLLKIICEKKEELSKSLLSLFTKNGPLDLEVYVNLIKFKKTNLLITYFNNDTGVISKINSPVDDNKTFLFLAVETNNQMLVDYFLRKGASYTYNATRFQYSPFHLAVIKGYLDIVEQFIIRDSKQIQSILGNRDAQNNQNIFHLIFLEKTGRNYEMLEKLWKLILTNSRKEFMSQRDAEGYMPLHYAVQCCDPRIIDFWGKGMFGTSKHTSFTVEDLTECLNKQTKEGDTGLHLAVKSSSLEVVQGILSLQGIKLCVENSNNQTPLTIAIELQFQNIMEVLNEKLKTQFVEDLRIYLKNEEFFVKNIEKALNNNHETEFVEIKSYILKIDLSNNYSFRIKLIADLKKRIKINMDEQHSMMNDSGFCLSLLRESILKIDHELLKSPKMVSSFYNNSQLLKTIKQKAFCRALKDSLVEYYFISRALYEYAVDPASGIFDEIKGAAETLAPAIAGATGIIGGLIATGGVAMMKFIKFVQDKNTRWQASRFVEAFGVAGPMAVKNSEKGIRIDHEKLSAVANVLYQRYRDQIEQCTLSMVGQGVKKISLTKTDGIAVLSQCMADRIFKHIINEGSINSQQEKSYGSKFWDAITSIGDEKDVYVETQNFSIIERCIFALFKEDEGKDLEVLTEELLMDPSKRKWQVGGILVKTGLKILDEDRKNYKFYIRGGDLKSSSLHNGYGFCYIGDTIECHQRGYTYAANIEDKFAEIEVSGPYHKLGH